MSTIQSDPASFQRDSIPVGCLPCCVPDSAGRSAGDSTLRGNTQRGERKEKVLEPVLMFERWAMQVGSGRSGEGSQGEGVRCEVC